MPFLFLSPSTQDYNLYVNYGSEQFWMNALADVMVPYLQASGINVTRNDPNKNVQNSIAQSNRGNYDFHLALHSNAAPEALSGRLRGIDLYYYPGKTQALRMAELLKENLEVVYPLPERVSVVTSSALSEIRNTAAPAVLAELGYHDNLQDAVWLQTNLQEIARALCLGVTQYFSLPFLTPEAQRSGRVSLQAGTLNLRGGPGTEFPVLASLPNQAEVSILNEYQDWYVVGYNGLIGYANRAFIEVQAS